MLAAMSDHEHEDPGKDGEQQEIEVVVPEDLLGGVWANFVRSNQTPHEITLDFCRFDPMVAGRMILVARVSFSPVLLAQLHDLLNRNWQTWSTQQLSGIPELPQSEEQSSSEIEDEQSEDRDDRSPDAE